jgi:glycosyltransferase involved in cell wall biosynthesis
VYASIVVPTYNRCAAVEQALRSMAAQSHPPSAYEVVVADDGSDDGTREMVSALQVPYRLVYAWQPNRGRCAARNLGLSRATGELILFLDGDMVAVPGLVAEHLRSHGERERVLVRGDIRLAPELQVSPYLRHGLAASDHVGHLLDREGCLPFSQALTGNLSIKRRHLDEIGSFDESLDAGYAWDDVDLGYRAHLAGLRLLYNPAAQSYHHDWVTTLDQQCQRMWLASKTVPLLFAKHPELRGQLRRYVDKVPLAWGQDPPRLLARKLARQMLATGPAVAGLKLAVRWLERHHPSPTLLRRCYGLIIGGYAVRGYREGLRSVGA